MPLNVHYKELVPYSVHSPSDMSMCLVFLLTQTNKRHLANSIYRNWRRKDLSDHSSMWSICRPSDKQQETQQDMQLNSKTIWNGSLVRKVSSNSLISKRLPFSPPPPHIIYLFNFDSRAELTPKEWSEIEQMYWQILSWDNLSRWRSAHNWAVGLCRGWQ